MQSDMHANHGTLLRNHHITHYCRPAKCLLCRNKHQEALVGCYPLHLQPWKLITFICSTYYIITQTQIVVNNVWILYAYLVVIHVTHRDDIIYIYDVTRVKVQLNDPALHGYCPIMHHVLVQTSINLDILCKILVLTDFRCCMQLRKLQIYFPIWRNLRKHDLGVSAPRSYLQTSRYRYWYINCTDLRAQQAGILVRHSRILQF